MKKTLIMKGDVQKLSECTFNQVLPHLKGEKSGTYTDPLDQQEEVMLAEGFAKAPDVWQEFVKRYIKHYPLSNHAMETLFTHLDIPAVAQTVNYVFANYGYTANEVRLIAQQHCDDSVRIAIMQTISCNVRMFDEDIYHMLEKYDVPTDDGNKCCLAEIYKKNVPSFN